MGSLNNRCWLKIYEKTGMMVKCWYFQGINCVDHDFLIRRLCPYAVADNFFLPMKLISPFSNRIRVTGSRGRVHARSTRSSGSAVNVSQGSNLGPFLILIYVNDLLNLVKGVLYTIIYQTVLFADDAFI